MLRAVDIIAKKRDKQENNEEEIKFLVNGYLNGSFADYQVAAWLMAARINGLSSTETVYLTKAMISSGDIVQFPDINKPLVDKHSSGGVGDKISLPLAPIAATMGIAVPMMSGRALGITGGTLDKLESINSYRVSLTEDEFVKEVCTLGYAMTGQTEKVAPADKLMYSLRDVTATVESVGLITASILSKKFAEGAQALVFDIKCGTGAFMKTIEAATKLAESIVNTTKSLNRKAYAFITNMNEPLGYMTGNFLEIEESILTLMGKAPSDILELTVNQVAAMALSGGIVSSLEDGVAIAKEKIASGEALELFYKNVAAQGGDVDKLKRQIGTRRGKYSADIIADKAGYVQFIDAGIIGQAGIFLGVGRNLVTDSVDFDAGFIFNKKSGNKVAIGNILVTLYANNEERLNQALTLTQTAFTIGATEPKKQSLIYKEIF